MCTAAIPAVVSRQLESLSWSSQENGFMPESVRQSTIELLTWLSTRPRTYGQAMETWRSTCPRLSIWEDAIRDGLVQIEASNRLAESPVTLTARGRSVLEEIAKADQ
jgi:hypothetical protein